MESKGQQLLNGIFKMYLGYLESVFTFNQLISFIVAVVLMYFIMREQMLIYAGKLFIGIFVSSAVIFVVSIIVRNLIPSGYAGWIIIVFTVIFTFWLKKGTILKPGDD